jgi:hypothetical protein
MSEPTIPATTLEAHDLETSVTENPETEMREFEFKTDLVIELPLDVDPQRFFDYLVRVMIAHTEAHDGSMGGSTKWHPYTVAEDE